MRLPPFKLERYFARWEFTARYLLCASDVESFRLDELLALADGEARAFWENLTLGYTESPGHPALRAAIASLYQGVSPEEVLVSAPEEAVFLFLHAALGPGDHVAVVWPAYQSLFEVARATGAEVTLVPLRPENAWQLDPGDVRAALRPSTRVIIINAPHNPTGAMLDHRSFDALVELAREAGAYLFADEIYRFLEYDPADRLPAAVERYERGVSFSGMSKAFALPGLRIGWLATRDAGLLQRVATLKDYTTICSSAPSEILALIALRARDAVLARSLGLVRDNLPRLDAFFARWPDLFEWIPPRAGNLAFPRLRGAVPIEEFCGELLEREGVLLLPGSVFDYPGNHFRVGFGRRTLPEALAALERFVASRWGG